MLKLIVDKRNFFSSIFVFFLVIVYAGMSSVISDLKCLCVISVVAVIVTFIGSYGKGKKLTGGLLYCICLTFMHMGQVVILAFGMSFTRQLSASIAIGENISGSSEAIVFSTLACMVSFAVVNMCERIECNDLKEDNLVNDNDEVYLSAVAWLVIAMIAVLALIGDFSRAVNVSALGYGAGYKHTNNILYYADLILMVFIFLIITVYKNNKQVLMGVLSFVMFRAVVSAVFIGTRSDAVLDIIMTVFAIQKITENNDIKKKVLRIFRTVCLIGIVILPFTGVARNNTSLTLSSFLSEYNPISYSLTEFGGTIVNVRNAIHQVGELPINDYLFSFLSMVPMSSTVFPFLLTTYGNAYSSYLNINYGGGLGGSLLGEAVFWFGNGLGGIIYVGITTYFVVICMNILERNRRSNNVAQNTAVLFLLHEMFYQIRGTVVSFQNGVKLAIYFYLIFRLGYKYIIIGKD